MMYFLYRRSTRRFLMSAVSHFILLLLAGTVLGGSMEVSMDSGEILTPDSSPREHILFTDQWRFMKGEPSALADKLDYGALKPWLLPTANAFLDNPAQRPDGPGLAEGSPITRPEFDDASWRLLNLPHDWGIEGPFDPDLPGETAKLPWFGVAWYRKTFALPESDAGRRIFLQVDGAMSYAAVWCNGKLVGGWPYGYASWQLDLTPYLEFGQENTVAIRLDNPKESSRWYPGGGLYRNVWLIKTAPVHIGQWGVRITTSLAGNGAADIGIETTVVNQSAQDESITANTLIYEWDSVKAAAGKQVAAQGLKQQASTVPANGDHLEKATLYIADPALWSPEEPHMYLAVTTLRQGSRILDRVETPFGIRTLAFEADRGFLLNGEVVELKGVCLHHDLGALGAAFHVRAAERQLEILKEMGVNAIRTAHNPPAPEFLDLCDRMGFLVMDELTDTWTYPKKPNGYALLFNDWSEADLRAMIRRDRNHPSIFVWSTGNEIGEQADPSRFHIAERLTAIAHEEDPTRPVTTGNDRPQAGENGYNKTIDIFGYNYKPMLYGTFRKNNPDQLLYGSETASTISSRGEYLFPVEEDKAGGKIGFQMSSYDLYAPRWAQPPDWEFKAQDEFPEVAGEFVWTGFDYLGEPTPFNSDLTVLSNYHTEAEREKARAELEAIGRIKVPSRSSYFGIVDLAGFKKDRFYIYQARWRPDFPMAHILPHWNWPDRVGKVTPVHVYTSGDEAELFLNGQSMGRKKKGEFEYRLRWDDVVYQPGELKVVAYRNGQPWAEDLVETTGPATQLGLEVDRKTIAADGRDLAFITLTVMDAEGRMVPTAGEMIRFEIEGPGTLIATDNGDPTDLTSFQSSERKAFNGLALAIVRADAPGTITLRANADGLESAVVQISSIRD